MIFAVSMNKHLIEIWFLACKCSFPGSKSFSCDNNGDCFCHTGYIGAKCDLFNHFNPEFERCNDYKPELEAGSQIGTRFSRVFATDRDGPESPNGEITYSIVSTDNKFVIDPNTGWISTNTVFNEETTVDLTIKASDNGRPQLEGFCTMTVSAVIG